MDTTCSLLSISPILESLLPAFLSLLFIFICFFWLHWVIVVACRIVSCRIWTLSYSTWDLLPWTGIEPRPLALGKWSLSHWTTREVPCFLYFPSCLMSPSSSFENFNPFNRLGPTLPPQIPITSGFILLWLRMFFSWLWVVFGGLVGSEPGCLWTRGGPGALLASRDFLDQVLCDQVPSEFHKVKYTWHMECYVSSKDSLVYYHKMKTISSY